MTTEKSESYNDSFNANFCQHLEYHLSEAFANSEDKELKYYWRSGVLQAPYINQKVNKHRYIRTTS